MVFYTISTFRQSLAALTKKSKDGKNNGFRLIYWVSMKNNIAVLLRVYPKRGPQSAVDLTEEEYDRLLLELMNESKSGILHQVDVVSGFIELSQNGCLPGAK